MAHTHKKSGGFVLMMVVVTLFLITTVALWVGRDSGMGLNQTASQQQQRQARYAAEAGLAHASWQVNAGNCDNYTDVPSTSLVGGATYAASVTPSSGSPVTLTAKGRVGGGGLASLSNRQPVYSSPVTVELVAAKDTILNSLSANNNYGDVNGLSVKGGGDAERSLLQFDMPAFVSPPHIVSAVLKLDSIDSQGGGLQEIRLYPLDAEWAEMEATWNVRNTSSPWSTPGGDHAPRLMAAQNIDTDRTGIETIDITNQVARWVAGEPNFGFSLRTDSKVEINLASREHASAMAPSLEITYRCECGQVCEATPPNCSADYIPGNVVYSHDLGASGINPLTGITYVPEGEVIRGDTVPAEGLMLVTNSKDSLLATVSPVSGFLENVDLVGLHFAQGLTWVSSGPWANHIIVANANGYELQVYDGDLSPVTTLALPTGITRAVGLSHIEQSASGTFNGDLIIIGHVIIGLIESHNAWIVGQDMELKATLPITDGKPEGVAHLPGTDKMLIANSGSQGLQIMDFNGQELWQDSTSGLGIARPNGATIDTASCHQVITEWSPDMVYALEPVTTTDQCLRYADDFSTQGYSGSSGETDWSDTPWLELGESDGPSIGNVYMEVGKKENWLVISGPDNGVERAVNLDDAGPTTLNITASWDTFDDAADKVTLEISSDAGASWTTLHEFANTGPKQAELHTFNITDYASADTRIRLTSSAGLGADDTFNIQGPLEVDACQ